MVNELTSSALICFTDGTCLTNSGPCGNGAVIYQLEGNSGSFKRPVETHGSTFFFGGGGGGVGTSCHSLSIVAYIIQSSSNIRILCDSHTAEGILTLNWTSNYYHGVIKRIKEAMSTLKSRDW